MDRFFLLRARAVWYLLDCRREWSGRVESVHTGDIEFEAQQLDLIDRLVLDVRAGRVHSFALAHHKVAAIFVTDQRPRSLETAASSFGGRRHG
jgi:hypothetical protein